MSSEAPATQQIDDPEMGSTWFYSFVGIIFFVAFCLAVSVMFFGVQRDFEEERVIDERPVLSTGLRSQQKELLAADKPCVQPHTTSSGRSQRSPQRCRLRVPRARS